MKCWENLSKMGAIEESTKQMGENFRNIPHIVIGGQPKNQKSQNSPFKAWKNQNYNVPQPPEDNIERLKKWGLILAVFAVICYSAYRIIVSFI